MRAACHAWEAAGRRVIPLATSAKSAEVLGAELGRRAENMHKFLHELTRPLPTDAWYTLRRGDVLLVDEAGMAGTLRLNDSSPTHAEPGHRSDCSVIHGSSALSRPAERCG